jgi:uroporphyrinogen decarboxylase
VAITSRERVLTALSHEEPDRVPIDLGGTQTGIMVEPYDGLKELLGITTETEVGNIFLGLARVEEEVMRRFQVDINHVLPHMPESWHLEVEEDNSFLDEWQIRWQRPPSSHYYDMVEHPLKEASMDDLGNFPWPDPLDEGRVKGVEEELLEIRHKSDRAIAAGLWSLFEACWALRGMENFLVDMVLNREFAQTLLDRVTEVMIAMYDRYLQVAGPHLDIVKLWDDYGTQEGPLISPQLFREMVKPRMARLIEMIRTRTSARIAIHCCGSIWALLDDLVDMGVEIINPVQTAAAHMDPVRIKARYGDRLSFWGGIDTQSVLPYGKPKDVRREVRQRLTEMAPRGGYILAAVHNIQVGVPPENIVAMYESALALGTYPLATQG